MEKNIPNGDSTEIKDTVSLVNGKFSYNFKIMQPKRTSFKLIKNDKEIGIIGLKEKNLDKIIFGNPLIGNENIIISTKNIKQEEKKFIATIEGAKQNKIEQKINGIKITQSIIKNNPNNFPVLWNLREQSNRYSYSELEKLSIMFSKELKASSSFSILQKTIAEKKKLETSGYQQSFKWVDINGKNYNFQEALNGRKYMLIILWASWCVPCRNEIPHLKDFNKSYQQNVSLVSLSIDEDYNRWKKAVIEEKMAWLNLSGLPKNKNQVAFTYDVKAVPTMILLDENGNIIQKNKNDLQKIIQAIEIYK